MPIPARPLAVCGAVPQNNWEARSQSRAPDAVTLALTIFFTKFTPIIIFLLLTLFANTSIKQIAIQQHITWSNMLNRIERHRSALTSALYKIKICVKTKWQHFMLCIATRPKVGPTWCNNTVDDVSSFTHKKSLSIFIQ